MSEDIKKKFPIIRWILSCFLVTALMFLAFDGINGFYKYPASPSDRNLIISIIMILYILIVPKNPLTRNSASAWNKPLLSLTFNDLKSVITLSIVIRIILWSSILVGICAAVWAVGGDGMKRVVHSYAVQLSIWVTALAVITNQCLKWQTK